MEDSQRIAKFLTIFKDLEKELIAIADLNDEFVSFSRALNEVYYNQLNPVVSNRDNYDFLKTASDLRNILSHENNACAPTEEFLSRFEKVSEAIISPLTCYQLASKNIISLRDGDSISSVIKAMEEKKLSHLPILDSLGQVKGIFSRSTFFDFVSTHEKLTIDDSYQVSDFSSVTGLEDHLNECFVFVSRYSNVLTAFSLIKKRKAHDKNVGLLLVTEHGKRNEKLLGVISMTDLAAVSISQ
jgi:predicted transcriptional regulator